jgi:hypothetical protein
MDFQTNYTSGSNIRYDPFVAGLLERLPKKNRNSFTDEQLLSLKIALSGRRWGHHAFDIRMALGFWRWHYYYVIIGGRERRQLSRRQLEVARITKALALLVFLSFSTLLGLLLLYLIKSALGINFVPGHSLGIWSWFR